MGVKIFLIRHGQTLWNEEGRYQGKKDIELTGEGMRQAKLAAGYLSKVKLAGIYSSPLKRALETAKFINKKRGLGIIIRDDLAEMSFGKWEGLKFHDISDKYRDDYNNWLDDPYNNPPTGGESFRQTSKRAISEVEKIVAENGDGSSIAVIAHGGVILSLLVHWLKIPLSRWKSIIQRQGAINIVVIDKGFPYISAINYTGHLKPVYDDSEDKIIKVYSSMRKKEG